LGTRFAFPKLKAFDWLKSAQVLAACADALLSGGSFMTTHPVSALPTPLSQEANTQSKSALSPRATPNPPEPQDKATISAAAKAQQGQAAAKTESPQSGNG